MQFDTRYRVFWVSNAAALRHQQPPFNSMVQWTSNNQFIYIWLHMMTDLWNKISIQLTKWRRIPKLMILNPASNSNEKLWEKKKYHVFYSTMMMITTMGKVGLVASSSSLTDKNNTTRQLGPKQQPLPSLLLSKKEKTAKKKKISWLIQPRNKFIVFYLGMLHPKPYFLDSLTLDLTGT